MRTLTLSEFQAELAKQGLKPRDMAFKCLACKTIQSASDLIAVGAGRDVGAVRPYLGFSCVGRFTGVGRDFKLSDGQTAHGCGWTLGGLLQLHELEVVMPNGDHRPHFELATPEEAQAHALRHQATCTEGAHS